MRIASRDIGILPLLLSFPLMFYPRVLDGDTQPWVLIAALIAFFTFRTTSFINRRDGALIILSFLCVLAYAFRGTLGFELLRHVYTYLSFLIFWIVSQREKSDYFPLAVRGTIVIWFIVGFCQYLAIKFGYEFEIYGRYVEGRGGVPSLTAEPSYYGSLSILQLMYILTEKNKRNSIFIVCAVASVILSGSILALFLLIFPLRKLSTHLRATVVFLLPLFFIAGYYFTSSELTSRLKNVTSDGITFSSLILDPSVNLRAGHLYYTMVENLIPSLLLIGPIDFMTQYNSFALNTGLLIETGSNYILPAIGEMIYGAGLPAMVLLIIILKRAQENCATKEAKIERTLFIIACMLNPISISNMFLIMYAQSKSKAP